MFDDSLTKIFTLQINPEYLRILYHIREFQEISKKNPSLIKFSDINLYLVSKVLKLTLKEINNLPVDKYIDILQQINLVWENKQHLLPIVDKLLKQNGIIKS